jgi:hypothetical protein
MLAETEEFLANKDTAVMKLIEASETSKGWFTVLRHGYKLSFSMRNWCHSVTNTHKLSISVFYYHNNKHSASDTGVELEKMATKRERWSLKTNWTYQSPCNTQLLKPFWTQLVPNGRSGVKMPWISTLSRPCSQLA